MPKLKVRYDDPLAYYQLASFIKDYIIEDTIIVCIGTDKCIGDCLGPLVGFLLKEKNFPLKVYGYLEKPIHALNLDKELKHIKEENPAALVIALDACLGDSNDIGVVCCRTEPLRPGKGVGKVLPSVGDLSIVGIIDSSDRSDLFSTRGIRLNLVMEIAQIITTSLIEAYSLKKYN
ncbi:MAG: spore protease YyaC [Sarcina sp.]